LIHDDHLLERRVKLLMARERELLSLRRKHDRLRAWISVTLALKETAVRAPERDDLLRQIAEALKTKLGIQCVAFFEIAGDSLRRVGEVDGIAAAPGPRVCAILAKTNDGTSSGGDEQGVIEAGLGLHRFMWHWMDPASPRLLLVAGYDRERAPFYPPFDEIDLAQLALLGHQLGLRLESAGARESSGAARRHRNHPATPRLSKRELEVSRLLALGKGNKEIASELGISPRTVQTHIEHIFDKVGERSRAAATRWLVERAVVG